jgi:endonuclease YncB( thermonuclease family)
MRPLACGLLAAGLAASLVPPGTFASAADLAGRASVIDGDTIEIHGQRIRLFGVDAPEARQTCDVDGKAYRCGQQAALALADHIGQRTVACEQTDTDRYSRVVAVCRVAGEDLGAWLVSQGWALAYVRYSREYVDEEITARAAKRGIWRGAFTPPWAWRRRGAAAITVRGEPQAAAACCKVFTIGDDRRPIGR